MISQEAKYHNACLAELYRKADRIQLRSSYSDNEKQIHGLAFAAVISSIEDNIEFADSEQKECLFNLSDLVKIYSKQLEELGMDMSSRIHSTCLKERILSQFEDMRAYKIGREVYLAYDTAVAEALKNASNVSYDDEAYILAKAARIVRRSMKKNVHEKFGGTFQEKRQEKFVSSSLLQLISMILQGRESNNVNQHRHQAALSITQLIEFNTTFRETKINETTRSAYHKVNHEPPLPIYLGTLIHSYTRSKKLIERFHEVGLSISYHRVMSISTEMGNRVIEQFEADKVVCPPNMKLGFFTTAAVDNIDHNPSSNTASGSFHGTAISLFQLGGFANLDIRRNHSCVSNGQYKKKLKQLPLEYTDIKPAILNKSIQIQQPVCLQVNLFDDFLIPPKENINYESETSWLEHVQSCIEADKQDQLDLTWAGFHAERSNREKFSPDSTALLPLFREASKSSAMIKHSLDVIKKAVTFLNNDQCIVVALDQPLYALAKRIQWQWPEQYGNHQFIMMLGGLHTEMAFLSVLGDWLDGSGWVKLLSNGSIATPGVAESFLSGSKVTKTKYAHEVTACSLYILMKKAYQKEKPSMDFTIWRKMKEEEYPQFKYWSTTLNLELLLLRYVRSLRDADFSLYINSINEMLPWFFALNHGNYARWLPIHLHDMATLHSTNHAVFTEFKDGAFVISKSSRHFSAIPIDHAHEQNNKIVKGDGGAIGLTENSAELTRWMVSGPEIARLVQEFQGNMAINNGIRAETKHHEQTSSLQERFQQHVNLLITEIESSDNPFMETGKDLIALDTKDIADKKVIETIDKIACIGKEKYDDYMKDRIFTHAKSIDATIHRNKLPLFTYIPQQTKRATTQISNLRNNVKLFSQLYIANQTREGDMESFFQHENATVPPSLSKEGQIRSGKKADLLDCLEHSCDVISIKPAIQGIVIEGAVLVNIIRPNGQRSFSEYFKQRLLPYLSNLLQSVQRLDVVWDVYQTNSLKMSTRLKRGDGSRRKVGDATPLPEKWDKFLRVDENKTDLFHYIANCVCTELFKIDEGKHIVTTYKDSVISSDQNVPNDLAPCNHEEGDYRSVLHAFHMSKKQLRNVMISTVDTDVVVIAVSSFKRMALNELWIEFGTGENRRYIPIHEIVSSLGPHISASLLFFHSFTGCDQVSYFATRGKKTAWKTWKIFHK